MTLISYCCTIDNMIYHNSDFNQYEYERIELNPEDSWFIRFTDRYGGTMATGLPISPLKYRLEHPTKAAIQSITQTNDIITVTLFCDWGYRYSFQFKDNELLNRIKAQFPV